ncbi:MAG TPA: alpha/beta hydrolase [Bacteroidales bacterium]|nr:alpha/beta hydrolase [Bacteroidales bacterium]
MSSYFNGKVGLIRILFNLSVFLFLITSGPNMQAQTQTEKSTTYIYDKKPSIMARNVKAGARLFVPKNSIKNKLEKENFMSLPAPIPKKYLKEFQIDIFQVNCRNVYRFSPKENKTDKQILYFHGGAYINNIFSGHWNFIAQIVRSTSCTVIIPDYPLAPTLTYLDAFDMIYEIYKMLLSETDSQNIIFMGDSAGAGLAMAFAEKLNQDGKSQPEQLILISPWLDVSMTNPEIEAVQKKDPILNAKTLIMAGNAWSGNSDVKNYMVSPIYGNFNGLPQITIFIGTHDVLFPDCEKFESLAENQNITVNYFKYNEMFHVWVLFPFLKESKLAAEQINALILD